MNLGGTSVLAPTRLPGVRVHVYLVLGNFISWVDLLTPITKVPSSPPPQDPACHPLWARAPSLPWGQVFCSHAHHCHLEDTACGVPDWLSSLSRMP